MSETRTHAYLSGSNGEDRAPAVVKNSLVRAGWVWVEDGPEGTVFVAPAGVTIEEDSPAALLVTSVLSALWHTVCPDEVSLEDGISVLFEEEEIDPEESVYKAQATGLKEIF